MKRIWRDLFAFEEQAQAPAVDSSRIEVWAGEPRETDQDASSSETVTLEGGLTVRRTGNKWRLMGAGSTFVASSGSAQIHLSQAFWAEPLVRQRDFFQNGVLMLLQSFGLHGLHASGVARGPKGALFVGGSGSGKTTATLALISQGWSYVSDDSLALRLSKTGVEAFAVRRAFSWTTRTREAFSAMHPDDARWDQVMPGKWTAIPGHAARDRRVTRCVPGLLLFPEVAHAARTRLEPIPDAEALIRLIQQSSGVLSGPETSRQQLELLGKLVAQSRCYRFLAGADVYDQPASVSDMLIQAAGSERWVSGSS